MAMPIDARTGIHWQKHGEGAPLFVGLPLMASQIEIFGSESQAMLDAWLDALTQRHCVLLADYPGIGKSADHDPATMTAERVVADILSVATAAGFERFAWAGYSWSAAVGLQLASRSDRISALAIGGWPALGAPYENILAASRARIGKVPDHARVMLRSDEQYRQWATFYQSLESWDEAAAIARITCPRMLYFGSEGDLVEEGYSVSIASCSRANRERLEKLGWKVLEIQGYGHEVIGRTELVLPHINRFLESALQ
ncbi:MAG: alpha/beta fold hydrolase [Sphingomonadales bacterium]|jgi:pimeloyl-ACP methyl ester carboxylesterase